MGIHEYTRVYMGIHEYTRVYMGIHEYTWVYVMMLCSIANCVNSYDHYIYKHARPKILIKSRLTIVSREAKKKQAVRNKRVSYLHVASL